MGTVGLDELLNRSLDEGRWTLRQKLIVLMTALTVIFDGMDIQMMGFAIPAIAKDWGLGRASFAPVLALGLFGITLGSVAGGLLGDRFGRRATILLSVLVFGLATLGTAFAKGPTGLLVLRFLTGLGIGGALPNAATLAAEYTPAHRRPAAVTLTIVCVPLGGLIAGLISSAVLPGHSWRGLFVVGGVAPLVLLVGLAVGLPESPRFLAKDPRRFEELKRVMTRMGRVMPANLAAAPITRVVERERTTQIDLYRGGLARDTGALWAAFFCCMTTVYLAFNWLPSVLSAHGFSLREASRGLTLYNFGGIVGALGFGVWITAKGSRVPMLWGAACAVVSAVGVAWGMSAPGSARGWLFAGIAAHGMFVNAVQTTLYALAAEVYPTRMRATGVASALAVGRTGAILSAFLGGLVVSLSAPVYFCWLAVAMGGVFVALAVLRRHIAGSRT